MQCRSPYSQKCDTHHLQQRYSPYSPYPVQEQPLRDWCIASLTLIGIFLAFSGTAVIISTCMEVFSGGHKPGKLVEGFDANVNVSVNGLL